MGSPFEWRLDDIERKANAAAPKHEVDALRGDVVRLEHTVREISAERDGLRHELAQLQARLQALEGASTERVRVEQIAERSAPSSARAKSAKEQFDEHTAGEDMTPLERLRFFCSLAMNGQDWLDVEPFFDAVERTKSASGAPSDDVERELAMARDSAAFWKMSYQDLDEGKAITVVELEQAFKRLCWDRFLETPAEQMAETVVNSALAKRADSRRDPK